MNVRLAAATVVQRVVDGESLDIALPMVLNKLEIRHHAVIQALSYGVLRQHELLLSLQRQLLTKPLRAKDTVVATLLQCGLFELLDARTPEHAVVSETVRTVKQQRTWAGGLVNACLRRFIRERENLLQAAQQDPEAGYLLPAWLLKHIQQAWPDTWKGIAKASNTAAPMTLRVNLAQTSRQRYQDKLTQAGIHSEPHPLVASALVLENPQDVDLLPGFETGELSVQDAAAQLAGYLLDIEPGFRVLDACAAPGGKSLQLLELSNAGIDLTALDVDSRRITHIEENLARAKLSASIIVADAGDLDQWWDAQAYDRILLDAPCSATGVIRRHPDIKCHRQPQDIVGLCARQSQLLDQLWLTLVPGGLLLYATCSILPEENSEQIEAFLHRHADAREKKMTAAWGRAMRYGRQILPAEAGMDGFYYACLQKI